MNTALITNSDKIIIKELAKQVAELAADPIEQQKQTLWYDHNELKPTRPVIFCDPENGWNEIVPESSLECESSFARKWEFKLRVKIFYGDHMKDDRVIEALFTVNHVYTEENWGLDIPFTKTRPDGSYVWDPPLKSLDDISMLRYPKFTVDRKETRRHVELAREIFDGILEVDLKTKWWWSFGITGELIRLHGMEQMFYDMLDNPEGLHRVMAFMRDAYMHRLDWLEENSLLSLNNNDTYVGSGGFGWSRELPQPDFNGHVRPCDMWGFSESQETVGVSPALFEEFVFQYQLPILERFGLNCYGCCEPLDTRWEVVKKIPRLRRVSVSPWANLPKMAENLQDKYILSYKPNPADLAMAHLDEDRIRRDIRKAYEITKGCRLEVIMKDNHTIMSDPTRVSRWVKIAREEADRMY